MAIRVTVWNENVHERKQEAVAAIYPEGIHGAIAGGLRRELGDAADVRTATLEEPSHGLTPAVLDSTDVLLWWGHIRHHEVEDAVVDAVHQRVLHGMGLIALHSAQGSKIFKRLMGTTCELTWRHNDSERVWTVHPGHPIARGVPHPLVIPEQEMYGEFFDIPAPDELVFISSFGGGEVFRSGCCFFRGRGRVFYFSPGHQEHPVYHQPEIQLILANAVRWAAVT
jgi:trehalose utilization protein